VLVLKESLCRIYIVIDFAIKLAVYRIRVQNSSEECPAVDVTASVSGFIVPSQECEFEEFED
jgi:hypothetical protein